MTDLLLDGRNLGKRYGGVVALEGVDIQLQRGEILGLVGPNGAGKTTLVDVITGAQTLDAGELRLNGVQLSGPPSKRARSGLARTFQHPQLAADLSVAENLLLGRAAVRMSSPWRTITGAVAGVLHPRPKEDRQAVENLAAEVNLTDLDRPAGELSLGEQRLVEVGRALGQNPAIMLLDDPFAGADALGIAGIIEAVRIVQRRGNGVIVVDHNVDLVSELVDRVMLLNLGHVAFDGPPADCLASSEMQVVYFGTGADHGS